VDHIKEKKVTPEQEKSGYIRLGGASAYNCRLQGHAGPADFLGEVENEKKGGDERRIQTMKRFKGKCEQG